MTTKIDRPLLPVLALAALVLAFASPMPVGAQEVEMDPQELFVETHKCSTCHSVSAAGIEAKSSKLDAGDLSGYVTDDFEWLAQFVRREVEKDGEEHKRPFKGTDEELQAILDWLGSLEPAE